jgi:transposase-like protein
MFRYPEERKNAVIQKMLPPQSLSVTELSRSEGLSTKTLYRWRKEAVAGGTPVPDRRSSSAKFTAEAKFAIVVETATLSEHELSQYCRERGLFTEQIKEWKQRFIQGVTPDPKQVKADQSELKKERQRSKGLERELRRKEKALAETAALLVLRKKANAIWGDGGDE